MAFEAIHNRLPPVLLQFRRMRAFRAERLHDARYIFSGFKSYLNFSAVTERIRYQLLRLHLVVDPTIIKAEAAVPGLHAVQELSAGPQVVFRPGRVPIVGGVVPLHDMLRFRPAVPDFIKRSEDGCLHGYLQHICCFHDNASLSSGF